MTGRPFTVMSPPRAQPTSIIGVSPSSEARMSSWPSAVSGVTWMEALILGAPDTGGSNWQRNTLSTLVPTSSTTSTPLPSTFVSIWKTSGSVVSNCPTSATRDVSPALSPCRSLKVARKWVVIRDTAPVAGRAMSVRPTSRAGASRDQDPCRENFITPVTPEEVCRR